jgi:hypothetical protein
MAGRTLGELCRKFGERILAEIMPILKAKSTSSDPRTRQGVALIVGEIMYFLENHFLLLLFDMRSLGKMQPKVRERTMRMI